MLAASKVKYYVSSLLSMNSHYSPLSEQKVRNQLTQSKAASMPELFETSSCIHFTGMQKGCLIA